MQQTATKVTIPEGQTQRTEFAARHRRAMGGLMTMFPVLRDAVEPAPVTAFASNAAPAELFAPVARQVMDGTFRLRNPADSPHGLVGPFLGDGACLEPLMPHGREILRWYDPFEPATDGDLVLCALDWQLLYGAVERGRRTPGWIEMYGEQPPPHACKMLRHIDGKPMLLTNNSSCWLVGPGASHGFYRNQVLGTLRYILIDGEPCYGSGPNDAGWSELSRAMKVPTDPSINIGEASGAVDTSRIDLNAATEVLYSQDAGPISDSIAPPVTSKTFNVERITLDVENTTDVIQIAVSGRMEVSATLGDGSFRAFAGASGTWPGQSLETNDSFETDEQGIFNFALVGSFTGNPVGSHTYGLTTTMIAEDTPNTIEVDFHDVNVLVAVSKR